MMELIYTLLVRAYGLAIQIAALFNEKARQWRLGRRDLFSLLSAAITLKQNWIWIHVSSLGEFEQGRPLIEMLREKHPAYGILLTFYSPSGYLIRKDYNSADYVTYMALDTPGDARRFVEIVRPAAVVFVKYDIWYHHLLALERGAVPTFLISAQLRADQVYFKPWGRILFNRLTRLTQIFTQTETCTRFLRDLGFDNVQHAGDTRLDRVVHIAASPKDYENIQSCLPDGPVLVCGSTWPEDEKRLIPAIRDLSLTAIIAPHEISEMRLKELEQLLPGAVRLSALRDRPRPVQWVIADTMGELAFLYALGSVAYVGGGFGKGIHNILEPVAYRMPVLIGPGYGKFVEAVTLKEAGVVHVIQTPEDLERTLPGMSDPGTRDAIRAAIAEYVEANQGATDRIYRVLRAYL